MSFKAGTRYSNDTYIMTETTAEGVSAVGEINGEPVEFSGGGDDMLMVKVYLDGEGNPAIDKTYAEIKDAVDNGIAPVVQLDIGGFATSYAFMYLISNTVYAYVPKYSISGSNITGINVAFIMLTSSDVLTFATPSKSF